MRQPRYLLAFGTAELPGGDDERRGDRDRHECGDGHPRLAWATLATRRRSTTRAQRSVVLPDREPRVVLVDERLTVEAERLRVRAQEATHVRRGRQDVELLVLERPQVLRTDLRPLLELGEVEILAESRLAEAGADVEHAGGMIDGRGQTPRV